MSAVKHRRTGRGASCFNRAARGIRRALSRLCIHNRPPSPPFTIDPKPKRMSLSYEIARHKSPGHKSPGLKSPGLKSPGYNKPYHRSLFDSEFYTWHEIDPSTPQFDDDYGDSEYAECYHTKYNRVPKDYMLSNTLQLHCTLLETKYNVMYRSVSSDQNVTDDRGPRFISSSVSSLPTCSQSVTPGDDTCHRTKSLPDLLLTTSSEEFTPDVTADEDGESYRFQCSRPGLYQCSVTGLVFHMEGDGDVVYRTRPWDRRLLTQHHKKPAGPLFDIKCVQQSVCRLHLPHCEVRSTGRCHFLSVAHVTDEVVEFIRPHQITETHVVINTTGFSGFGNVKDEDVPANPVRALVLLFYRPPADPDPESLLNVLLLPRNVVLQDVLRTRKKLVGHECYIETSPHCKLHPKQEYTLSTCPEDDSVLVQPMEAEFDSDNYDNYFPSFQVCWETMTKHMKLSLRDAKSSHSVWERRVCLSSTGGRRDCGPSTLSLPPDQKLLAIRSHFIDGISGPVLKSLLDKLFEKMVMGDSERESADEMQNKRDKARFVIDTVRKKGGAASSEMIEFLCEADPFLCEHLGLI